MQRRYAAAVACAAIAAGATLAIASLGAAGPPSPAGTLEVGPDATAVTATGLAYTFGLRAVTPGGGGGDAVLGVVGPGLTVCTVHGSGAFVNFDNVGNEFGETPSYQCGRAFGQTVAFNGCVLTVRAHGYLHADHPLFDYLGTTTIDIRFKKTGPNTGTPDVVNSTPGAKIELHGKVAGPITMSTCP